MIIIIIMNHLKYKTRPDANNEVKSSQLDPQ